MHYYFSDHLGSHTGAKKTPREPRANKTSITTRTAAWSTITARTLPRTTSSLAKNGTRKSVLDYFGARHYSSSIGRFMVPDPAGVDSVDFTNPQSWNLYAYVVNNPLTRVDPNGLCDEPPVFVASSTQESGAVDGLNGDDPCMTPPPSPPDVDPCQGKSGILQ